MSQGTGLTVRTMGNKVIKMATIGENIRVCMQYAQVKQGILLQFIATVQIQMAMEQVRLLEQYIASLESENQAKNRERETLYSNIADLQVQADQLRGRNSQLIRQNQQLAAENEQILSDCNRFALDQKETAHILHQKERQLQAVIKELDQLSQAHHQLIQRSEGARGSRLSYSKEDLGTIVEEEENGHQYDEQEVQSYRKLEKALNEEASANEELKTTLRHQGDRIHELEYFHEKNLANLSNLEELVKEYEKTEVCLKQELEELKQEYRVLEVQLEENCQPYPENIRELITNYQKIQKFASEQEQDNQALIREFNELKLYISDLEQKLQEYEEKRSVDFVGSRGSSQEDVNGNIYRSRNSRSQNCGSPFEHPPVSDVVRQNNKLIEKITQLEREKNQLYLQKSCHNWKQHKSERSNVSPLKNSNWNNHSSVGKLKFRIEALRQENQNLMEALRLD